VLANCSRFAVEREVHSRLPLEMEWVVRLDYHAITHLASTSDPVLQ